MGSFVGNLYLEALLEYAKEIKKIALKYNCKYLFNDLRKAIFYLSITDIYYIPDLLNQFKIDRSWKIAIIVSEKSGKHSFFETVVINRGHGGRLFTDPIEAMIWLKER